MDATTRQMHRFWGALLVGVMALLALRKTKQLFRIINTNYNGSGDNNNRYIVVGSWFSNISITHGNTNH